MVSDQLSKGKASVKVEVDVAEFFRGNPISPEAQDKVTKLFRLNEELLKRQREHMALENKLELLRLAATALGLLGKGKGSALGSAVVSERLAGLGGSGFNPIQLEQIKSIVNSIRSSEFGEQVVRNFQAQLFPLQEQLDEVRKKVLEQAEEFQKQFGASRKKAIEAILIDPANRQLRKDLADFEPRVRLLNATLVRVQERLPDVKAFERLCEERLTKELSESQNTLDIEQVKKQTEEFKKFQETGGASVENLGMQVQKLVADTEHSFGKLPGFAQREMGNVEGLFEKSLGQMATRWFGFIRQMVSGAQAGGRGILEGLFGGLFGILGGGRRSVRSSGGIGFPDILGGISGMGTPPFILNFAGSGTVSAQGTVSQSGAGEIPKALGGATQGLLGALVFGTGRQRIEALKSLGLFGAQAVGSFLTQTALRAGGPVKGLFGGALLGLSAGVLSAGSFGVAFAGSFAGPIGLAIGAGVGLILGIIGRGRAKRNAARMQQQIIDEAIKIVDQFKQHKIQFEPAIAQIEALKAQGIDSIRQARLGRAGRRAIDYISSDLDRKINKIRSIQKQREAILQTLEGFPIPEFARGGPVGFGSRSGRPIHSPGGGILAMLHPGEFVLKKQAVESVGLAMLEKFNRRPQAAPGEAASARPIVINQNVTINALDGANANRWWKRNRSRLASEIRKLVGDRAL